MQTHKSTLLKVISSVSVSVSVLFDWGREHIRCKPSAFEHFVTFCLRATDSFPTSSIFCSIFDIERVFSLSFFFPNYLFEKKEMLYERIDEEVTSIKWHTTFHSHLIYDAVDWATYLKLLIHIQSQWCHMETRLQ